MQEIKRSAIINKITSQHIFLKIERLNGCHACIQKKHCSISQCQEKLIKLPLPKDFKKREGDSVVLRLTSCQSKLALILGFILPLLLIFVSLITLLKGFNQTENLSAVITLCILGAYYLLLAAFRNKLNKFFNISISPE